MMRWMYKKIFLWLNYSHMIQEKNMKKLFEKLCFFFSCPMDLATSLAFLVWDLGEFKVNFGLNQRNWIDSEDFRHINYEVWTVFNWQNLYVKWFSSFSRQTLKNLGLKSSKIIKLLYGCCRLNNQASPFSFERPGVSINH